MYKVCGPKVICGQGRGKMFSVLPAFSCVGAASATPSTRSAPSRAGGAARSAPGVAAHYPHTKNTAQHQPASASTPVCVDVKVLPHTPAGREPQGGAQKGNWNFEVPQVLISIDSCTTFLNGRRSCSPSRLSKRTPVPSVGQYSWPLWTGRQTGFCPAATESGRSPTPWRSTSPLRTCLPT